MGVVSHWLESRAEGRGKKRKEKPAVLQLSPLWRKVPSWRELRSSGYPGSAQNFWTPGRQKIDMPTHQSSKSSDWLFQRGDASWLGHLHTRAGTTGMQPSQIISCAGVGFLVMLLSIYPYSSQWSQQNHRPTKLDLAKSASSVCALSRVNPDGECSVTSHLILLQPWGTVIHKTVSQIQSSFPAQLLFRHLVRTTRKRWVPPRILRSFL